MGRLDRLKAAVKERWPVLHWLVYCLKRPGYVRRLARSPFLRWVPPGHYYSPVPALEDVATAGRPLPRAAAACPGIDLRETEQIELLERFSDLRSAFPFDDAPQPGMRYRPDNDYFNRADAAVAYAMLRLFAPRRVVEIGSGFSSALMFDVDDLFNGGRAEFTFIEPEPARLLELLGPVRDRRFRLLERRVQEVPLEEFEALAEGDVLFIDSSHVVKVGSDVAHILTHVLPRLRPGVLVHFHDIFWPFEYPPDLLRQGIAWNETYCLRAFLQFNRRFSILYFSSFMAEVHAVEVREKMPVCLEVRPSSLWLVSRPAE